MKGPDVFRPLSFQGRAMKKIRIEGPIGMAAVIGAIIGGVTGGLTSAVQIGASLGVATMVVLLIYNAVAR